MDDMSQMLAHTRSVAADALRTYFEPLHWLRQWMGGNKDRERAGDGLAAPPEISTVEATEPSEVRRLESELERSHRLVFEYKDLDPTIADTVRAINADLRDYLKRDSEHSMARSAYEQVVAQTLKDLGWQVHLTSETRDGGVDIIIAIENERNRVVLMECKAWSERQAVGVDVVRSLWVRRGKQGLRDGLFATTADFEPNQLRYASTRWNLKLDDYTALLDWINLHKPSAEGELYVNEEEWSVESVGT